MLRDLADIDALLRELGARAGFWDELIVRARLHGLGRALWYGLDFGAALFATPVPGDVLKSLAVAAPGPVVRWTMARLGRLALLPESPDRLPSLAKRIARRVLFLRYLVLRFPLRLLVFHAAAKGARRLRRGGGAQEPQ